MHTMRGKISRRRFRRTQSTGTINSDGLSSTSSALNKSTDSKKRLSNVIACLRSIGTRIGEKLGMADETRPPRQLEISLPEHPRTQSIPSKPITTTSILNQSAEDVLHTSAESSVVGIPHVPLDIEISSPLDDLGQIKSTQFVPPTISLGHIENATRPNRISGDNGSDPAIEETRRVSVVLSLKALSGKNQEDIIQEVNDRGLDLVDHSDNRSFDHEEKQRAEALAMIPSRTPPSSLAQQRFEARRRQRHEILAGGTRPRPENDLKVVAGSIQAAQVGLALNSSSLGPLSRNNSSATSTRSDSAPGSTESDTLPEWLLLQIGINGKNGNKHWRILSLDTMSDVSLVAHNVVEELGLIDQIEEYDGDDIKGLGHEVYVKPVGRIKLSFSVFNCRRTHVESFLVLNNEDMETFDAIGSRPLVLKKGWIMPGEPGAYMAVSK